MRKNDLGTKREGSFTIIELLDAMIFAMVFPNMIGLYFLYPWFLLKSFKMGIS